MKATTTLHKISSVLVMLSMVLGLFASPAISIGAVVKAQDVEPTPTIEPIEVPTEEIIEPTLVPEEPTLPPEEPTLVPEEPTLVPEEPTLVPEEPTQEPTLESTLEPTMMPTLEETASPTPTEMATATPTSTELPEVVPMLQSEGAELIPDQYIVVYKNDVIKIASSDADTDLDTSTIMEADITSVGELGGTVEHEYTAALNGFSAHLPPEALKKLRQNPNIDFIEQDSIVSINDDIGINSIQESATWGIDRIDQVSGIDGKYTYFQTGAGVHAYIIDTGITAGHSEFGGRATFEDNFSGDGNNTDCNGHGTHVAGTIGGASYGVAKAVTLHGIKVFTCSGSGPESNIIAGINWVTAHHISPSVVNMSLGGFGQSDAETIAINNSIAAGITYVVSAGNDAYDACLYSPASIPAAITVGATDLTDSPSYFSNYGSCVDIFAPGTSITSSWNSGGINTISGTSMASPHVAGAVALLLESNTTASPATITSMLLNNSVKNVLHNVGNGSPNKMLFTKPLPNPTSPVLVSPVVGATVNSAQPTLTWNAVTGAAQYRVQISTLSDFSVPFKESFGSSPSYVPDITLAEGLYYWRVMSINDTNVESPWSASSSFIVDTTPPVAPVLSSPANASTQVGTPSFVWNSSTDAVAYQFQHDTDPGFTSPDLYTTPGDTEPGTPIFITSHTPTNMTAGEITYWRVRAVDAADNWGAWSAPWEVVVQPPVPVAPTLNTPANGVISTIKNPVLTWNNPPYGDTYRVQIATTSAFTGELFEEAVTGAGVLTHTVKNGLAEDIKYYWRVRAINTAAAESPWSEVRSFSLDTEGPVAPVLTAPLDGATPVGIPTFTWAASVTAKAYQFQYSADGFTSVIAYSTPGEGYSGIPIKTLSHKPTSLPPGITYTWRVRAIDAAGNWGAWSAYRTIIGQASLPASPVLTSPAAGFITKDVGITFNWSSATLYPTYQIQINMDKTFPGVPTDVATNSYISGPLGSDGLYYWRVRARNASNGYGAWSAVRSFTIDSVGPAAPVLTAPLDSTTPVGTPTFKWAAVTGANAYQFQYHIDSNFDFPVVYSTLGDVDYPGTPIITTSHKPPAMTPGNGYFWRVRGRDAAGNWGAWSALRVVNVQVALPVTPVLLTPATAIFTNNSTPTLTWKPALNATQYQVQIDQNKAFPNPSNTTSDTTYTPGSSIGSDGLYYWRVRSVNSTFGASAWSAARTFTLDTTPPAAPVLKSPDFAAAPIGTNPTFTWIAPLGVKAYQFQLSSDDIFSAGNIIVTTPGEGDSTVPLAVTTYKLPTSFSLTVGTTYYWHVKARDVAGNWGSWSAPYNFVPQASLLAAPVLTSPATGYLTKDIGVTFNWNPVATAASYQIQINLDKTFPGAPTDAATNTYSVGPLGSDGLYYWRVRARNASNGYGAWSAVRSFTIDTVGPAAPVLTAPLDSATPVGTPIFKWAAVTGANAYQFQYHIDSNFDFPVVYSTLGDVDYPGTPIITTSHKPPAMTPGNGYFWRVRGRDAAGNWGAWSALRVVNVQVALPVTPVLLTPATAIFTNNSTPTLTWKPALNATQYQVQIDQNKAFPNPSNTTSDTTYTPGSSIGSDGLYYWRVRSVNSTFGASAWSAARTFTLLTTGPTAPVLTAPLNAATPVGTPTFTWAAKAGAKGYQFEYATDSGFTNIVYANPSDEISGTPITTTSHKPASMAVMTTFYWRVRAKDAAGNWGTWSETRSIKVLPAVPAAPVLGSPAAASFTYDTTPTFNWSAALNAYSYRIQIARLSTFVNPVVDAISFGITFEPGQSLGTDGLYYWRVQSINAINQAGAWSAARSFTLDTVAPLVPTLIAPVEGTILPAGIPTFTWTAVTGAKAYQFEMDDFYGHPYATPVGTPITTTSHKPTSMTPALTYYWHVRAIDAAGNWGPWSNYRRVVEQAPLPAAPVLSSPPANEHTTNHSPTFAWNSAANASTYEIQIDKLVSFTSLNKIVFTGAVGVLNYSVASSIPGGDYYWRVRGKNANSLPGPWSAVRKLTFDFYTDFTTAPEWNSSQFSLSGGNYVAPGISSPGYISSATYDAIFSNFTFETSMRMPLSGTAQLNYIANIYGVFVHAGSSSGTTDFSTTDFSSGYYFEIAQARTSSYGNISCYSVEKIVNGNWTSLTNGSFWCIDANTGGYNTLKVVSNGSSLSFYINGTKIKSISNSGPLSGKLGVMSYWLKDKEITYVDYAQTSAQTSTVASIEEEAKPSRIFIPAEPLPKPVFGN